LFGGSGSVTGRGPYISKKVDMNSKLFSANLFNRDKPSRLAKIKEEEEKANPANENAGKGRTADAGQESSKQLLRTSDQLGSRKHFASSLLSSKKGKIGVDTKTLLNMSKKQHHGSMVSSQGSSGLHPAALRRSNAAKMGASGLSTTTATSTELKIMKIRRIGENAEDSSDPSSDENDDDDDEEDQIIKIEQP